MGYGFKALAFGAVRRSMLGTVVQEKIKLIMYDFSV